MSDIEKREYSPLVSQKDADAFQHPQKPTKQDVAYYTGNVQPRLFQVSNMISQKKPESQIFAFLGLSAGKFDLYKRWFPDFRNAVASGKVSMVSQIEHALMQLSTGGDYQESQIVNVYEPDPDTGQMVLVQKKQRITKKVAQPNIRAIQMYLTNKNPQNWRRSQPDVLTQNNTQAILNVSGDQVKGMLQTFQKQFMIDTKPSAQPVDVEVVDE